MLLHGLLSLHRETVGTVALVAAGNSHVLAVTTTAANGRFQLEWPPLAPGAVLYGFPGQVLEAAAVLETIGDASALVYEAIVPLAPADRVIFVNAITTCVSAVLRRDFAFGAAPAALAG